jgi:hypothetical protein
MGGDQMRAEQSRGEEKGLLKMKRKRKRGIMNHVKRVFLIAMMMYQ